MALNKVWVFAEVDTPGKPTSLTLELLTKAREMAGTVEAFVESMRLRGTVGADANAYHYERDVEQFFRHSPAVVRDDT